MRTIAEINEKIQRRQAIVWTVEELKAQVTEIGIDQAAALVDVVTTGTFEPMESSGAILNLGQTDPPIKIRQCWLDGVPAYAGFGAVDLYLGATQVAEYTSDLPDSEEMRDPAARSRSAPGTVSIVRGGGHVISDLVGGKSIQLRAL
ncbi:MAG: hypothetical protein F6K28_31130, partial [Microcoleus sp. SIO2G3]|nr:hypothetical protein [Microcoleus sp. SIO2G3]